MLPRCEQEAIQMGWKKVEFWETFVNLMSPVHPSWDWYGKNYQLFNGYEYKSPEAQK